MKERRLTDKTKIILGVGKFIGLIIGIISLVLVFASWKSDIDYRITTNTEHISIVEEIQKEVVEQLREQDGLFIEIMTDLKWIRAKLQEE